MFKDDKRLLLQIIIAVSPKKRNAIIFMFGAYFSAPPKEGKNDRDIAFVSLTIGWIYTIMVQTQMAKQPVRLPVQQKGVTMNQKAPYLLWVTEDMICEQSEPRACLLRLRRLRAAPCVREPQNHFHPEIEISLFLQGHGSYIVNKKCYPITPGDIFLCRSMDQHCFSEIDGPDGLTFLTIHFEPRFIWSPGNDMFDAKYLQVFENVGRTIEHRLPKCSRTEQISRNILNMEQEFIGHEADYEAMVKALLLRMLVLLNRLLPADAQSGAAPASGSNMEQIEEAMAYIQAHLTEPILLSDLAKAAHMSPCYFSAIFKRLNGVSPWRYITAKRIELAQDLLTRNRMSITEVSQIAGYNNAANFNRAFRQITGTSPSAYRKHPQSIQK